MDTESRIQGAVFVQVSFLDSSHASLTAERCRRIGQSAFDLSINLTATPEDSFSKRRIDFFISHSWDDGSNAAGKFAVLMEVTRQFEMENGRKPTFFIDQFCLSFDEDSSVSNVGILPMCIMACDQMLVLYTASYQSCMCCMYQVQWRMYSRSIAAFDSKPAGLDQLRSAALLCRQTNMRWYRNDQHHPNHLHVERQRVEN
jgi:hypothetical protein